MKDFITKLMALEGAAITLASILCGRVIGQVARGFAEDEEVAAQANLYQAIAKQYPANVIKIPAMFSTMLKNADNNSAALEGLDLTDEEKAEWAEAMGESEFDRLRNSARALADLMKEQAGSADANSAWHDLSPLAQHSLALRTERNLQNGIKRYSTWNSEKGAELLAVSEAAVEPLTALVSKLCESLSDEIEQARSNGINVATRAA